MKNALLILLSLVAAIVGVYEMIAYVNSVRPNSNPTGNLRDLVISLVCLVAALALGGIFLAGRVNKEEELHITK